VQFGEVCVAVDAAMPIEIPLTNRAIRRPVRLLEATKTIALTIEIPTAGSSSRRRPYKSDRWPARSSATMTPTAYIANATVTMNNEKLSRARYRL
jgi:hypothetical protein